MSAHTKGPWYWLEADNGEDGYGGDPLTIAGPDNTDLAIVFSDEDSTVATTREEAIANARLIAAAPELLEALQRVLANDCPITGNPSPQRLREFWECEKSEGRGEADDMLFALAALAKATGGA